MNAEDIITTFELQVDDTTELSTSEELLILNRIYKRILSSRPWEFLKKTATGTILQDSVGYYITLPTDYQYIAENATYTDNTMEWQGNAVPKIIFVGSQFTPIRIVNFSDRRQYRNRNNVAYVSLSENKIRFTNNPNETTYEFDYIYMPANLTISDEPVFPTQFRQFMAYGMAAENDILQISEKARSYRIENEARYTLDLRNMEYWNANQRYD